jgi:putative protease
MQTLELLSPAKNLTTGLAAIDHGADAVYIGPRRGGARASAGNSTEDIATLCGYAHRFGAKVYATVNTLVRDDELEDTRRLLNELAEADVDAVLVQDMAVARLLLQQNAAIPEQKKAGAILQLHASTQTDNRTAERVKWLYDRGFQRVVLARELSVDNIRSIHHAVPEVELEAFVHGALCVSYSGRCYASERCLGRSANRGECAQMCRMRYDLVDADGHILQRQRHLLSLKDLCRLDYLEELAEAGVCSFKIEGRLKDVSYVKNVTAAYSQALDKLVKAHPNRYRRASWGHCNYSFQPDVQRSFNRGFTTYGLHGREQDISNPFTPKSIGAPVGTVRQLQRQWFSVSAPTTTVFANGDGLCFLDDGQLVGFRVNKAEGLRLYPAQMPQGLRPGTMLYRNYDHAFERQLEGKTSERKMLLEMALDATEDGFRLDIRSEAGQKSEAYIKAEHQMADKPQRDNIVKQLSRLGGTPYECAKMDLPEHFPYFIPSSLLADLRRKAVEALPTDLRSVPHEAETKPRLPLPEREDWPQHPLMQCHHCLRYALGRCVKHGGRRPEWREPLHLVLENGQRFRLEFDCVHCQMNLLEASRL